MDNFDSVNSPPTTKVNSGPSSNLDLLDLLGGLDLTPTPMPTTNVVNNNLTNLLSNSPLHSIPPTNNFLMDGLLGSPSVTLPKFQSIVAYDKNGLRVDFSFDRPLDNPNLMMTTLTATSSYGATLSDFLFQAAVPKTFQLQIMPASGTLISGTCPVTQVMRITNPTKAALKMRIKISFTRDGSVVQDQGEVNNFPPALWQ